MNGKLPDAVAVSNAEQARVAVRFLQAEGADFEYRDIYFLSREIFESDGGQHFEKAGMPW